jgi:DNA-binding winged helix-turn-helix (wHTH) protein/tetratricopeptide (TPR) repeat protein
VRIRFNDFELDEENARLDKLGKSVALRPTPFNLLCTLARQPGALLSKEALLDAVWGHQFVSESVLKTAISDLRIALGDNPREPRFIETVSRRGYRFIAVATEPSSATTAPTPLTSEPAAREMPPPAPAGSFFVGRAGAMARLQRAWASACEGQRAIVWVAGEPGIGKSTLVEHFAAGLADARFARGQCVEHYGTGEPYLPVLEALAELCRANPDLVTLLRDVAPTWLLQLPWLTSALERDALRRELAGVGPERMLRELGELLDRCTEHRPLLLVTEDLHWSDRATIQLIDYIARRRGRARLMWLATFRLAEVIASSHPLNPLRRELRLHRLCDEVVLDPFSETEVADLVAQRSAALAGNEGFVRALHARTDGVPLFVSSVIAEVMESTTDTADMEQRLAAIAVPENLAAIIDHYIDRLDDGQRVLLQAAAVCGVEFRIETLALALGRDATEVGEACERMVREHMWLTAAKGGERGEASETPYAFVHALFREVLYERMAPLARASLHRQVGVALEREGSRIAPAELAMHFDRGRQPLTALRYYAQAAEAALSHFSPTDCMTLTARALALLRQMPERAERDALAISIDTLRGVAAFQSLGLGHEAKDALGRAFDRLASVPDHPMRGRLLHGYGYLLSLSGDYDDALAVARRAQELSAVSGDQALMLAACIVQAEVHHLQGHTSTTREWIERGLALAASLDAPAKAILASDPQVTLTGLLALEDLRCGLVETGRAGLERTHQRARESRQPMARLVATWQEALFEVRLGNAQRVATLADEIDAVVEDNSIALGRTACRWWRGWAMARRGAALEGYRLIRQAYDEHVGLGMRAGASEVLGYAAEALLLGGDLPGAQAQLDEALWLAKELDEHVYLPQLFCLQAALDRALGRHDAGESWLRRAIQEARAQPAPWFEILALVELCEHYGAAAQDRLQLRTLLEELPQTEGTAAAAKARRLLGA